MHAAHGSMKCAVQARHDRSYFSAFSGLGTFCGASGFKWGVQDFFIFIIFIAVIIIIIVYL